MENHFKITNEKLIKRINYLAFLGKVVEFYPITRFKTKLISPKFRKVLYIELANDYLSGGDTNYHDLPILIKNANRDIKILMKGGFIKD